MRSVRAWLLLLSTVTSWPAAFAEGEAAPRPIIWTNGNYDALKTRFPESQFDYQDPESRRQALLEEGYLQPMERDRILHKVGIERKLKNMDEMDKDMLVMDARSATIPELRKYYPRLTETELRRLKSAVRKVR